MSLTTFQALLGWSALLNMALLLWWFFFISFARDWTFRIHSRFYRLSEDDFDRIHYTGMLYFKIILFMFFVVPYLALRIILTA